MKAREGNPNQQFKAFNPTCRLLTKTALYFAADPFYLARNTTVRLGNWSLNKLAGTPCIERCHPMALQCLGSYTNLPWLEIKENEPCQLVPQVNFVGHCLHFNIYLLFVASICYEPTYIWRVSQCHPGNWLAKRMACNRTARWCFVIYILIGNQRNCNAQHIVQIAHVRRGSHAAPAYTVQWLPSIRLSWVSLWNGPSYLYRQTVEWGRRSEYRQNRMDWKCPHRIPHDLPLRNSNQM